MPKLAKNIVLTDAQKSFIDANLDMDVCAMGQAIFNDPTINLRRAEIKAIRSHISSRGSFPMETVKRDVVLSDANKEHIKNNYLSSSALEMARILSGAPNGGVNMRENHPWVIAITKYIRVINPDFNAKDAGVESEYVPPRTIASAVELVNKYAQNPLANGKPIYELGKLTPSDKKNIQALIGYMNTPLFYAQIGKYTKKADRELFESEFVKNTWNKCDLLGGELTQSITFVSETVKYVLISRQEQLIDDQLNDVLTTDENKDIKMAKVELLNSIREKANASLKQQAALLKSLEGDRSKRINEKISANGTMHNLVESWKNKEKRDKLIKANEMEKKSALKQEVERLSALDEIIVEIFGLDPDDILL